MPTTTVFAVKLLVSVLLCGIIWLALRYRSQLEPLVYKRQNLVIAGLLVCLRVVPFVGIFLILNETPRGDIPFFYWKADLAHQGKLVYRDFWSFHSPLFSYILALPMFIWNSPKAIVALMGIGEAVCLWVTYRFYRKNAPDDVFWKTVVYLLLPAPLIICLLGGQEDIWLWGFGLWAVLVWQQTRNAFKVGLVLALALLTLKAIIVIIVFPVFFMLAYRGMGVRFAGALLSVGIPVMALLYLMLGWLFLMPVQHAELPFAPNLTTVIRPFTGGLLAKIPLQHLNWFSMVLTLTVATLTGWRFRAKPIEAVFPALWVITFGCFMLFLPSAMAYYLFLFLIVLVFELTDLTNPRQVAMLLIINILVVVQPFVMIYSGQPFFDSFRPLRAPLLLLEYGLEVAFVSSVIYYVRQAWLRLDAR
ncbi:MAG: hypothetical protein H7Z72_12035 [Bacteroidetes bacterium]|nr:hypothetical protein [Fibrella sp.]